MDVYAITLFICFAAKKLFYNYIIMQFCSKFAGYVKKIKK